MANILYNIDDDEQSYNLISQTNETKYSTLMYIMQHCSDHDKINIARKICSFDDTKFIKLLAHVNIINQLCIDIIMRNPKGDHINSVQNRAFAIKNNNIQDHELRENLHKIKQAIRNNNRGLQIELNLDECNEYTTPENSSH